MKINYRQLSLLVFMSFISLKLLALPSLMYKQSDNMTYLVTLVLMVIDALYVFILLDLMKKCGSRNLQEFMCDTIGPVLSRVVLAILIVRYALVAFNITKGLEFFIVENLYSEFKWYLFILPLITVSLYMVYKGIRNIARVTEIVCWAIILSLLYIGFKAIGGVDIYNFLPQFTVNATDMFKSGFSHISWFGSSTFMLLLFGKVDFSTEKKSVMIRYVLFAILIVQFLFFIFVGLFGITSTAHNYCVSDISQFSSVQSAIDELSWLVVSLWIVAQCVQLALYTYCLTKCLTYMFNTKSKIWAIVVVFAVVMVWVYIGHNTVFIERVFLSKFASIVSIVAQYFLPILLQLGWLIKSRSTKRLNLAEAKE